jgi:hypothetical protein
MTYEEWKTYKETAQRCVDIASTKLKQFPRGEMGLTPDSIRQSKEWQQANREYQTFFKSLQEINKAAPKAWLRKFNGR